MKAARRSQYGAADQAGSTRAAGTGIVISSRITGISASTMDGRITIVFHGINGVGEFPVSGTNLVVDTSEDLSAIVPVVGFAVLGPLEPISSWNGYDLTSRKRPASG